MLCEKHICILEADGTKYLKSDLGPKVATATDYYEYHHHILFWNSTLSPLGCLLMFSEEVSL